MKIPHIKKNAQNHLGTPERPANMREKCRADILHREKNIRNLPKNILFRAESGKEKEGSLIDKNEEYIRKN